MLNPTRYAHHIYTQLEPNDRLIVGNAKRYDPIVVPVLTPQVRITEEEDNRRQDEYVEWAQLRNPPPASTL